MIYEKYYEEYQNKDTILITLRYVFYNLKLNYIPPPIQWYVDGPAVFLCFSRRRIVYGFPFPLPLLLQAEKLIPGSEEHVSHGLL